MEPRFFNSMTTSTYTSLWNKYRPLIVSLMVATEGSPQEYRFFDHEFKAANTKDKKYSFEMTVHGGKALNNIKKSKIAQDLLSTLNSSRKGSELLAEFHFEFSLDKHFIFHVSRKEFIQ